jgi:hypothetical protein
MAQHAVITEVLFAREASADTHPHDSARAVRFDAALTVDGAEVFCELNPGPLGWYGHFLPLDSRGTAPLLDVQGTVTTAGGTATVYAIAGQAFWQVNGATASNGAAVFRASTLASQGRICAPIRIYFGGAALAALVAIGAVQTVQLVVRYAGRSNAPYTSEALFGAFADVPPNSASNMASFTAGLLAEINAAGAQRQLGIASNGTPIVVRDCAYAALSPTLTTWIDPSDIGVANEQIPADVGSNLAAKFAFHPSAFIRRNDYTRSVAVRSFDSVAINTLNNLNQPVTINSVTDAPTSSEWLFLIDGHIQFVRIPHPAGSDFRRPRDVWNNIIVPALQAGQGPASARTWDSVLGQQPAFGSVSLDRLRYMSYARMVSTSGTVVRILQTGTGGLG